MLLTQCLIESIGVIGERTEAYTTNGEAIPCGLFAFKVASVFALWSSPWITLPAHSAIPMSLWPGRVWSRRQTGGQEGYKGLTLTKL